MSLKEFVHEQLVNLHHVQCQLFIIEFVYFNLDYNLFKFVCLVCGGQKRAIIEFVCTYLVLLLPCVELKPKENFIQ